MESTVNNNSINYITYYLGNPEDILRSTRIKLFYRKDLTPSLSNILEIHETMTDDPDYNESGFEAFLVRESSDDCFEINFKDGGIFNSIIYYTTSSSIPVGFTNFYRDQSLIIDKKARINSIKVYTSFNINNSKDPNENSLIINSLVDLRTFMNDDTEISSKLVKNKEDKLSYSSVSDVLDYFSKTKNSGLNYRRYTSSLTDLISDSSFILTTDCISLCGGQNPSKYKFSLSNGIEINTYDVIYTKFFIGQYKNIISLFEWSDDKETRGTYRVISLTEKNRFGLPKVLVEKSKVENLPDNLEVELMSGDYIIFVDKNTNDHYLYNISTKSSLSKISSNLGVTCNSWEDNKLQYYNKKAQSILETFNKESSMYKEFLSLPIKKELYSSLFFLKKVGNWYVFKTVSSSNWGKETLMYSSKYGSVYFDMTEEEYIIPVNDKILLVQTKANSDEYKFSFYFVKLGQHVFSDKYSEINGVGIDLNNKIEFLSSNSSMSNEDILKKKNLIDGLRHSPIESYGFPKSMKFISSYCGILFYTEEIDGIQKIFYL